MILNYNSDMFETSEHLCEHEPVDGKFGGRINGFQVEIFICVTGRQGAFWETWLEGQPEIHI